jgi:hypothetical protein
MRKVLFRAISETAGPRARPQPAAPNCAIVQVESHT